jgi:hypothetical protein
MNERETTACTWYGGPYDGLEIDVPLGLAYKEIWVQSVLPDDSGWDRRVEVPIIYMNGGWMLDWTGARNWREG